MDHNIESKPSEKATRPRGIIVVALLMILFGLAEIATGFSHNFIGLVTSHAGFATSLGIALGSFYFIGGLLILVKKKWAAILAIVFLGGDVLGRITMVLTGLYPVNSFLQTFAIVVGTSLAVFFAVYIGMKLRFFG
jgi:hypothetical protein